MTDTVDSGTSNTYQNDNPRRLSLTSFAFSNYTAFTDTTVRDNTKDTPDGSTETLVGCSPPPPRPTACCSFRTPPNPTMSPTTPTTPPSSTSAPDTENTYPTSRTHRGGQPREDEEPFHDHLGQLQQASPVHEPHLPEVDQRGHRDAYHHQPQDNREDDDPAVRNIAAPTSPGWSTTGKAPDPGLRDPTETT